MERTFDRKLKERHSSSSVIAHYTRKETFLECILPSDTLRLGRLTNTNDPRESKEWSFPSVGVHGANLTNVEEYTHRANEHLNRKLRNRAYVCCGTMNTIDDVYDCYLRPRMWAQYADNHEGVCLLLHRNKMDSEVRKVLSTHDELLHKEVYYANSFPFSAPVMFRAPDIERSVDEFIEDRDHRDYFLLHKHTDWEGENEYRWIIVASNDDKDAYFITLSHVLVGIVVGINWPSIYNSLLRDRFPRSSDVVLGQAKWLYMDGPSVDYYFDVGVR